MSGLPSPQWPIVDDEGKLVPAWYNYLRYADETWRTDVIPVTSLTTVLEPGKDLLANNGISLLESVPATTRTLAAPIPGCRKTICVVSTSSEGKVTLPSTTMFFRNQSTVAGTTGWKLVFSSTAPYKAVELLGISTFEYLIVSNIGTVTVATT